MFIHILKYKPAVTQLKKYKILLIYSDEWMSTWFISIEYVPT